MELASLSTALREEHGERTWVERKTEEVLAVARQHLDPSDFERAWQRGERLTPEGAIGIALAAGRAGDR